MKRDMETLKKMVGCDGDGDGEYENIVKTVAVMKKTTRWDEAEDDDQRKEATS